MKHILSLLFLTLLCASCQRATDPRILELETKLAKLEASNEDAHRRLDLLVENDKDFTKSIQALTEADRYAMAASTNLLEMIMAHYRDPIAHPVSNVARQKR